MNDYGVYLLRLKNNHLYCGITNDRLGRLAAHNDDRGAKNTKGKGPATMVYWEEGYDRSQASQREWAIKRLRKSQKEALIQSSYNALFQKPALVSACLVGFPCRYDGQSKRDETVCAFLNNRPWIPFCPEIYGGLPTPRPPAELQSDGRLLTEAGQDVTAAFYAGAQLAYQTIQLADVGYAILKSKSPSCGSDMIYDGSFQKNLIKKDGITAAFLRSKGIYLFDETTLPPVD